jgi:hypothetical protein
VQPDPDEQQVGRRHDVDLYVRTYNTVLRTSGDVHLRAFERARVVVARLRSFLVETSLNGCGSRDYPPIRRSARKTVINKPADARFDVLQFQQIR